MKNPERFYTYIYLDTRKPGEWEFEGVKFEFQPFYIGKGEGKRIRSHLTDSETARFSIKNNIINKIRKETGADPIKRKVFENLEESRAFEKEISMIQHFGRIDLGTGILANLTNGGPGCKSTIVSSKSREKQSNARKGRFTKQSKRVDQFTLQGVFIKKFDSITKAADELNLTADQRRLINRNCWEKSKTALGYIWKFDGTSSYVPPEKEGPKNKIVISRFDLNGDYIKTYESINLAALEMNCPATSLSRCCQGKRTTCRGYQWRYGDSQENIGRVKRGGN